MRCRPNVRIRFAVLTAAALVIASAAPAWSQETEIMYGGTARSSGGSIVIVDPTDASYDTVGSPVEDGPLPAIAMDAGGRLFVSNNDDSGGIGKVGVLRRVDPVSGAVIETIGTITDGADDQPLRISSMEFSPTDGLLYGVIARDDNIEGSTGGKQGSIVRISTTTAVATVIGSTGLARGGLAFSPDGRLYLATARSDGGEGSHVIARIDPSTGAVIGEPVPLSLDMEIEGMAFRPSDGVLFANYADGNRLYTIDPLTGTQVEIGSYSGGEGHVADLTFRPVPLALFGGLLLPEKVRVKLNTKRPTRSSLSAKIRLDGCCSGLSLGEGGTFTLGGLTFDLATAKTNKKGTRLSFKGEGAKIVLRTGIGGTSRGAATVKMKGDLDGVIGEGGTVAFRLVAGSFDEQTIAVLDGSRFDLRRGGAFDGAPLRVDSLRGRVNDPGGSSLRARLGVASVPDGEGAPDVMLSIRAFSVLLSDEDANVSGTTYIWSAPEKGVRRLVLDTESRLIDIDLDDVTLGYESGPLTIVVTIRDTEYGISITPRAKGSAISY